MSISFSFDLCYHFIPLLFAIVTHPLLVMLSRFVMNGDIMGLHIPFGGQRVAKALVDDYFMFPQFMREYWVHGMLIWNQFALPSRLNINRTKSSLMSCTKRDLECLGWQGYVVKKGSMFQHLGIHWEWM